MTTRESHWQGLELRHLAALAAISQAGSFSGAAPLLGYTQSTVSEQIAALERIVGQRLIDRPGGPKQVSLTAAGDLLLGHARAVTERISAAEADLRAMAAGNLGELAVGTYQSASRQILPLLLRQFSATWPKIDVRLTESADDSDFFPMIISGELDIAFAVFPIPDGPFEYQELLVDPYVLVVQADSALATRRLPARLEDLQELRLIGFRQRRSVEPVAAHFRVRGLTGRVVFQSDDYGTLEALVASGMGTALVPRLTVSQCDPSTRMVELADDLPARRIVLVWHRDRRRSRAAEAFIEEARAACDDLKDRLDRSDAALR